MLDENISWKDHIKGIEIKLTKIIGLLYRSKPYLHATTLKNLYFLYI